MGKERGYTVSQTSTKVGFQVLTRVFRVTTVTCLPGSDARSNELAEIVVIRMFVFCLTRRRCVDVGRTSKRGRRFDEMLG